MIMMAMLLLGYQASPVQKKMLGVMDYKHKPFYKRAVRPRLPRLLPVHHRLHLRPQRGGRCDPAREFPNRPMLFDPKAEWLLVHQQARPYGTETDPRRGPRPGRSRSARPPPRPVEAAPAATRAVGRAPASPAGPRGAAAGLAPTNP